MTDPLDVTLHASGAESSSGSSAAVDIGARRSCAKLLLAVTVTSGTLPSLVVAVETSVDGLSGWRSLGEFDTQTTTSSQRRVFAKAERFIRASWTISGTSGPSFSFAVSGTAHVLYATPDDLLNLALPAAALANVAAKEQAAALLAVTDEAAGYLNGHYTLPLVAWDDDLRMHVAAMGAYATLKQRGFDPAGKDDNIVQGRADAIAWLRRIENGQLEPPGIIDSTPGAYDGGAAVVTQPRRGW